MQFIPGPCIIRIIVSSGRYGILPQCRVRLIGLRPVCRGMILAASIHRRLKLCASCLPGVRAGG